MDTAYKFIRTKFNGNVWSIPGAVMDKLMLKENDDVILQCGSASTQAHIRKMHPNEADREMGVSANILKSLGLIVIG